MTYLSIIEKFKILFESLFDFEFILVFMILLILLTFLFGIRKLSTKKYVLFMIISFVIVFSISIISNYEVLSNTFDNFTTIFFGNIYFPSIYVYISVLVISFISFITSMLNKMMYKVYKVINTVMFIINNFLFVIVLNIIAKNKIDIFSVNSLYTNTSLVAILELSMGLCILWFLSLIVAYITNVISEGLTYKKAKSNKKKIIESESFSPLIEVNVNLGNSSDSVNVDEKLPLLIEQISNNEVIIDDNNISEENIDIETIDNAHKDIIIENTTVEEDGILEDIVIDTNNIAEEDMIVENNIEYNNISNQNVVIEMVDNGEENVTIENNSLTLNDILNACVPVNYYDNNIIFDEYTLSNPQKMYEDNYNKVKCESVVSGDISINDLIGETEVDTFDNNILIQKGIEDNIVSVDNLINEEKQNKVEERLHINTVSLNDLIDDKKTNIYEINNNDIDNKNDYTVEDYKKMTEMLNAVKSYTNNSNINIDDAVAISLIKNYSIEECLKFKNILKSNLN